MSRWVIDFIQELVLHFGEPKFDVPEADRPKAHAEWLRSMSRGLMQFDADVLKAAAYEIISTRKYRSFPLLSECLDACFEVRKRIDRQKPRLPLAPSSGSGINESLAHDLINGPLGRQAAREGWIGILFDHCRSKHRLPEPYEIQAMKREAQGFDDAYATCVRGEAGVENKALEALGAKMLARREALRQEVLGEVAGQ